MICPTCQKQVLSGMATCQFCGSDLRGMAPTQKKSMFIDSDSYEPVHSGGKPNWVYPAYYSLSAYFALSGIVGIFLIMIDKKKDLSDPFTIAMIAIHGIGLVVGLGLLAKIEVVRAIVNYLSFAKILGALRGILGSLTMMMISTGLGILFLIFSVLDLCAAVMMIYLIGETD